MATSTQTAEYVDLCGNCAAPVDPESHLINTTTRERFCGGECWAEGHE